METWLVLALAMAANLWTWPAVVTVSCSLEFCDVVPNTGIRTRQLEINIRHSIVVYRMAKTQKGEDGDDEVGRLSNICLSAFSANYSPVRRSQEETFL